MWRSPEEQLSILSRKTAEVVAPEELLAKLRRAARTSKPLKVKLGLDPTAPDLHLGHTVVIQKLREFQDLGHDVIFLIGDFTGMIGDPSGRSETRKVLTAAEVQRNAETYKRQIFKLLDPARTRIDFNSRWMQPMSAQGLIELAARHTVARMLERDDFAGRYASGRAIGIHEFLYPLVQGYDSVALEADVELGGTDQKFNLLVGRDLQRTFGQDPQVIITMPILEGLDGVQKMSKSLGNYIGIEEAPGEMFGKVMSLPDTLLLRYYELTTPLAAAEVEDVRQGLATGGLHPREAKARLGRLLVGLYHSSREAEEAAAEFDRVFRDREPPSDVPPYHPPPELIEEGEAWLVALLAAAGACPSRSEARRVILQGGVTVDGVQVREETYRLPLDREHLVQVGKRRFLRVIPPAAKREEKRT
ncbi:MAG: tyrosine--tRNA ligase [candidate division NC10 bacterium]|nr:tyrosine--tRNA ligase [candidate division NC10 bacterium]